MLLHTDTDKPLNMLHISKGYIYIPKSTGVLIYKCKTVGNHKNITFLYTGASYSQMAATHCSPESVHR